MAEAVTKSIHLLAVLLAYSCLFAQLISIEKHMSKPALQKVAKLDAWFFLATFTAFVAGLILWFALGKPKIFYTHNWLFKLKLIIFIITALISIYPSLYFFKLKINAKDVSQIGTDIIWTIRVRLLLILSLPPLAVMMSRGWGL